MELTDVHGHTSFSYCASDDLTLATYRAALDEPGGLLARQGITNHGFQAYFPPHIAWSWAFLDDPTLFDSHRAYGEQRFLALWEDLGSMKDDRLLFGIEVELMGDGRLTVSDPIREKADLLLGSLHVLPRAYERGSAVEELFGSYLAYVGDLIGSGVDVLAHPFRWLREATGFIPRELVAEVVAMASAGGVAVELNLRGGRSALLSMIQECVAAGVPIALGTDAHAVHEVGRLEFHLEYLRTAGFEPEEVLLYEGRGTRVDPEEPAERR